MKPLSEILPKPLLPIDDKPVIWHTITAMITVEIEQIGLVVKESDLPIFQQFLEAYFPQTSIDLFIQDELTGIVTAIQSARSYKDSSILACAGDTKFSEEHLRSFIIKQDHAEIMIGIAKRSKDQIERRSNIIIDDNYYIVNTIEKPDPDQIQSPWSGVPIWMFTEPIWQYFPKSSKSNNGEFAVEGVIDLARSDNRTIKAVEVNNTVDITSPKDVLFRNFPYINELLD